MTFVHAFEYPFQEYRYIWEGTLLGRRWPMFFSCARCSCFVLDLWEYGFGGYLREHTPIMSHYYSSAAAMCRLAAIKIDLYNHVLRLRLDILAEIRYDELCIRWRAGSALRSVYQVDHAATAAGILTWSYDDTRCCSTVV